MSNPEASKRPKILLVTRNYPPLVGGMERLIQQASEGIADWADLTIVGPTGCTAFAPPGCRVHEAPAGMAGFLWGSTLAATKTYLTKRYDMVLGGSGLVLPILFLLKKLFGVKTALFIHGLDLVANNAIYQRVFIPCIRSADIIIANSRNTRRLAIEKGASADRISVINPGTDLPNLAKIESREAFCGRFSIPFRKIILFTGRITRRKGLSRFITNSLVQILEGVHGAGLVVVGENPNESLNNQGEAEEVMKIAEKLALLDHVRFLGKLRDEDLLAAYAAADVQVLPLVEVDGDIEGFGMVVIEAASCGTPTVAFEVGGVVDAIAADGSCGKLIASEDYAAFSSAVIQLLREDSKTHCEPCLRHTELYGWSRFGDELHKSMKPRKI